MQSTRPHSVVNRALLVFLLLFDALWIIAISTVAIQKFGFHRIHPYDSFLMNPANSYWDFTVFAPRYAVWGEGEKFFTLPGFPFTYPAPLLITELAYYKCFTNPLQHYLLTMMLFSGIAGVVGTLALPLHSPVRRLGMLAILSASVVSFPLMFLLNRGNIEGIVWIASAVGMTFFMRRWFAVAAIFLGLAASMKLFPAVLLLLFIGKRRYREGALAVLAGGVFTIGSLWMTGPTISAAMRHIAAGMDYFRHIEIFEYHPSAIGFDHSFFAVVKQVAHFFIHDVKRLEAMLPFLYIFYFGVVVAAFAFVYFAHLRKLPLLNQFLALSALSITLPFISYDYTLVHMFGPCAALILFLAKDVATGRVRLTLHEMLTLLVPFAVIFTPQSYLLYGIVGFGGQVKALALLALVIAAIRIKLPSSMFGDIDERLEYQLNPKRIPNANVPVPQEFQHAV